MTFYFASVIILVSQIISFSVHDIERYGSKMKKMFRSVVTLLLVAVMLFGVSAPVVANAVDLGADSSLEAD